MEQMTALLAQYGLGQYIWDTVHGADATAKAFFSPLLRMLGVNV